jgi:hypothetical protein
LWIGYARNPICMASIFWQLFNKSFGPQARKVSTA